MLDEMRRLSIEDSLYFLNVIVAGISIALIHAQKLNRKRSQTAADAATSASAAALASNAAAADAATTAYEERLEFVEKLNRGTAVEFLEMSDMTGAYQAYKRSKGEKKLKIHQAYEQSKGE